MAMMIESASLNFPMWALGFYQNCNIPPIALKICEDPNYLFEWLMMGL